MPNQPRPDNPNRSHRIEDKVYNPAYALAAARGESIAAVISQLLVLYVATNGRISEDRPAPVFAALIGPQRLHPEPSARRPALLSWLVGQSKPVAVAAVKDWYRSLNWDSTSVESDLLALAAAGQAVRVTALRQRPALYVATNGEKP